MEDGVRSELARQIGSRARHARLSLKKTQADIAEAVDLVTEVYGRLERGDMLPSVPTLVRIAAALKVTPNDLLMGTARAVATTPSQRPQRTDLRLIIERLERVRSAAELRRVRNILNAALGSAAQRTPRNRNARRDRPR